MQLQESIEKSASKMISIVILIYQENFQKEKLLKEHIKQEKEIQK